MTEIEAKGFIQGKLDCMEKCDVFNKEDKHRNNECDNCEYCYSQGTFGEQKEAFSVAIKALEKQMKLNEMGDCYIIPKNGVFEVNGVDVNLAIQKQIPKKPKMRHLKPYDSYNDGQCPNCEAYVNEDSGNKHCPDCGQKLDWSDEE